MLRARYIAESHLFISRLFGRGAYEWYGKTVPDIIPHPLSSKFKNEDGSRLSPFYAYVCNEDVLGGKKVPMLVNLLTRECFLAKKITSRVDVARYEQLIMNPISPNLGLWPDDLVSLSESQRQSVRPCINQEYSDAPAPLSEREGDMAVLFPYPYYEMPPLMNAAQWVKNIDERTWKTERIRHMAVGITMALHMLNRSGYAYHEMHLSRFFFNKSGAVYLDFSDLICPTDKTCAPSKPDYPLEFADPAYYFGAKTELDLNSQNYSLAAMLFYLLMDHYAYDGDMAAVYPDDELAGHYTKVGKCLEAPIFVFSKGAMEVSSRENSRVRRLWKDLPEILRRMFCGALTIENVWKVDDREIPTPADWLDAFSDVGWT